ncbi:hypothetical protein [Streptococcus dentiloxodontae]
MNNFWGGYFTHKTLFGGSKSKEAGSCGGCVFMGLVLLFFISRTPIGSQIGAVVWGLVLYGCLLSIALYFIITALDKNK